MAATTFSSSLGPHQKSAAAAGLPSLLLLPSHTDQGLGRSLTSTISHRKVSCSLLRGRSAVSCGLPPRKCGRSAAAAGLPSLLVLPSQTDQGLGRSLTSSISRRKVSCSLLRGRSTEFCGLPPRKCGRSSSSSSSCTVSLVFGRTKSLHGCTSAAGSRHAARFCTSVCCARCQESDGVSRKEEEEKKKRGDGELGDRDRFATSDISRIFGSSLADEERAQSSGKSNEAGGKGKSPDRKGLSLPPRMCTLRAFGDGGGGGEGGVMMSSGLEGSLLELVAASVQASVQLRSFETLSGRLAMMAFFSAITTELVTGNSVFKGIDANQLAEFAALSALATLSAAVFAFAWRARSDVAESLSKGAVELVDSALDTVVDGLFYEEEETLT